MAVLSADKSRNVAGTPIGFRAGVAASTTIYAGALLALDAGGSLLPAADTASLAFAGVSTEQVANVGADDVVDCGVQRGHAEWFLQTGLVQAQLLKNVFVSDDNTVTDAAAGTNDLKVGTLLALSGSEALIHIGVFAALDA
jgi:hypothetical protein